MSVIETISEPQPASVELDEAASEQLDKLSKRTGLPASELVGIALASYEHELQAIEAEPPFTPEQVELIERGLQAMREGRVRPSSEVFARLDNKYGG